VVAVSLEINHSVDIMMVTPVILYCSCTLNMVSFLEMWARRVGCVPNGFSVCPHKHIFDGLRVAVVAWVEALGAAEPGKCVLALLWIHMFLFSMETGPNSISGRLPF
jgi:hypothetical protein